MHRMPLLLSTAALAGLLAGCAPKAPALPPPAPAVTVITVQPEDVPVEVTMVGRIVTDRSVAIVARVTGVLLENPFTGGGLVKEGEVLFRLDPREYQANLDAALARQTQAENRLAKADADLKRCEALFANGGLPQQQLDDARTAAAVGLADLRAAQAATATARIQLGYTTVTAPFSGRIGQSAVSNGALLSPQSGTLATLDQIDPIDIEFTVSEESLLALRAELQAGRIQSAGRDRFTFTARLLDGSVYEETGVLNFSDIRFRPETGTALAQARFPNPKGQLLPGQFARLSVTGLTRVGALLVPQGAVVQNPTGTAIYVVAADGTAESRVVRLGEWNGTRWRVADGLRPGDRVVVNGIQKVRAGAKVAVAAAP